MNRRFKKFAAGLTALVMTAAAMPTETIFAANTEFAVGDVNRDGKIDSKDVEALRKFLSSSAVSQFAEGDNAAYDVLQEGQIDSRDLYALSQYVSGKTKELPTKVSEAAGDTVSLDLTGGECFSGGTVTLDVSIADWTKDIAGYDIVLRLDLGFSVESVECAEGVSYAVEDSALKLFGVCGDAEQWRGSVAAVTLKADEKASGQLPVAIDMANLFDSNYNLYETVLDKVTVPIHDLFAPVDVRAEGVGSASAKISWEMPFADQPIATYTILRNDKVIGQVPAEQLWYLDKGLTAGTEYKYTVIAELASGSASDESLPALVTPAAPKIKSAGFTAKNVCVADSTMELVLEQESLLTSIVLSAKDSAGKTHELPLEFDGSTAVSTLRSIVDIAKFADGDCEMTVTVTDIDGASDSLTFPFHIANLPPQAVKLQGYEGECSAMLTWDIAVEASANGYRIFRKTADSKDWEQAAEIKDRSVLSWQDSGLDAGKAYTYAISVTNEYGLESEKSAAVTVTPKADTTPPEITYFEPKTAARTAGSMKIAVTAKDANGVESVSCEISADEGKTWETLFSENTDSAVWTLDTTTLKDGVYTFRAMAKDKSGLETGGINQVAMEIDNTAPEQVTGVKTEVVYPTQATIAWDEIKAEDCAYFLVVLTHGGEQSQQQSKSRGINLYNLVANTKYTLTVYAVDQLGNMSEPSEPLHFITTADQDAPVITNFRIYSDVIRAGGTLNVYIYATDTAAVPYIYLQYSQDKENWKTLSRSGPSATFELCDSTLEEGKLYLRAYAKDVYGNIGDKDAAAISEITVDNTPPAEIPEMSAEIRDTGIFLSWKAAADTDIATVRLERAVGTDGKFEQLLQGNAASYFDKNAAVPNQTYVYRLCAYDKAGNCGKWSEPLEITFTPDNTAPTIAQCYVSPQKIISSNYNQIQVIASDNIAMADILLECQCDDQTEWTAFTGEKTFSDNSRELKVTAEFPAAVLEAKEVRVRVTPQDKAGNSGEATVYTYSVDNYFAKVVSFDAKRDGNSVVLDWKLESTEHITYAALTRSIDGGKEYTLYYQKPDAEQLTYSFADARLEQSGSYVYRLEVACTNGNLTVLTLDAMAVQSVPVAVLNCEKTQKFGAAYRYTAEGSKNPDEITAVKISYGDGQTDTAASVEKAVFEHTYAETGTYTVTLECTNADGFTGTDTATVTVEDTAELAEMQVTVTDTAGSPAAYAAVYVDVGTEKQEKYVTDGNGKVTFLATAGMHEFGVFGENYLPMTKNFECVAGAVNELDFAVVVNQLVDASFKITRMTFDEIKAAGINVADPANSQIVRIDISLNYQSVVSDSGSSNKLSIYYDSNSGRNYLPQEAVKQGYRVQEIVTDKNRKISTVVVMHIPTEVRFLKEFFNVEMIVINNAQSEFVINDCEATLNVPDGMTLMETAAGCSPRTASLGTMAGGETKSINWIVRGDRKGSYLLSADFTGTLAKFNESINKRFTADEPIIVNGLSAVDVQVNVNSAITGGTLYVEIAVKNNTTYPINELSTAIGDVLEQSLTSGVELEHEPTVRVVQTRFKGTNGIMLVRDETTESIEELKPGETFSVLYGIHNYSPTYAISYMKYLRDTLKASSGYGSRATVTVKSGVGPIDTNSIFYGINVDPEHEHMFVVQNKAKKAIPGASVKVYELPARFYYDGTRTLFAEGTADERGRVILPKGTEGKYYQIVAEAEDYKLFMDSQFVFRAGRSNYLTYVTLSAKLDSADYKLRSAYLYLDGVSKANLLSSVYCLTERDRTDYTIGVCADIETTKFELYRNGSLYDREDALNGTAEFSISGNRLSQGDTFYVLSYAPTGDSLRTNLKLQVAKPAEDFEDDLGEAIENTIGDTGSMAIPTPQDLVSIGWTFELNIKFPEIDGAQHEMTIDTSSFEYQGKYNGFKFGNENDGNTIFFTYKLNLDNAGFLKKLQEIKIGSKGKLSIGLGFEFKGAFDMETCVISLTGSATVKVDGSCKFPIFTYAPPPLTLQLKLSAGASITAKAAGSYHCLENQFTFDGFSLGGEFKVGAELDFELGVPGVLAGGVYGALDFHLKGIMYRTTGKPYFSDIYLEGNAGLVGEALGFEAKIKLVEGKIYFLKNNGDGPVPLAAPDPMKLMLDTASYTPAKVAADDTAAQSKWNGKLNENGAAVLLQNAYSGCAPRLAVCGDKVVMVWLEQDAARGEGNATHMRYAVYDSKTSAWSEPKNVSDSTHAAYSPELYAGADGIYLAYQESDAVFDGANTMELEDYSKQISLKTAKFNAETGAFASAETLAEQDGKHYICEPTFVTAADGSTYAFWEKSNNYVIAEGNENSVCYAKHTDKGWSAPTVLMSGVKLVKDLAGGLDAKGNPCVYVVTDTDGSMLTIDDGNLVCCDLSGKTTEISSEGVTDVEYGEHGMIWLTADGFYALGTDGKAVKMLDTSNYAAIQRFEYVDGNLLFNAVTKGSKLYAAAYDSETGTFRAPVECQGEAEHYYYDFDAASVGGKTIVVYKDQTADLGGEDDDFKLTTNLSCCTLNASTNLALTNVSCDIRDAKAGEAFPMQWTIANRGTETVNDAKALLKDAAGKTVAEQALKLDLVSGAETTVDTALTLPADFAGNVYTAEISVGDADKNPADNTAAVDLSQTDLALSAEVVYVDDLPVVMILATNQSSVPASATVHIKPQSAEEETVTLISEEIAPQKSALWSVDAKEILGDTYHDFIELTLESDVTDAFPENNSGLFGLTNGAYDEVPLGDVDFSGQINEQDATMVLTIFALNVLENLDGQCSGKQMTAADVDGNGTINETDAVLILQYFAYQMLYQNEENVMTFDAFLAQELNGGEQNENA